MTALTDEELKSIELPKWPGLVVVGDPVTEDQAAQIILRTDRWMFLTNDRAWQSQIYEAIGIRTNDDGHADYGQLLEAGKAYGVIPGLGYVGNDRIASSYINGPNGWCRWNGQIFTNDTNVGEKWPTTRAVLGEWRDIAAAFPFLKLRCQLLTGEAVSVEPAVPAVEYVVADGQATAIRPGPKLAPTVNNFDESQMMSLIFNPMRERGCTIETFKRALALCRRPEATA